MMHMYGHNSVLHNKEADKLAKTGAPMSVVHKMSRQCWSAEGEQRGSRQKIVRERRIKRQVVVQVTDPAARQCAISQRQVQMLTARAAGTA